MWHFSISYHFSFYSFDWIILKTTIGLCWFVFVSLLEWICYLTLLIISSRIIFFISKYLWDSFLYFLFIDVILLMCCFLTCAYYMTCNYFKFVVNPFMCNLLGLIFKNIFSLDCEMISFISPCSLTLQQKLNKTSNLFPQLWTDSIQQKIFANKPMKRVQRTSLLGILI